MVCKYDLKHQIQIDINHQISKLQADFYISLKFDNWCLFCDPYYLLHAIVDVGIWFPYLSQ